MSEKNRFSKPVAFNKKNEKDQLILKHVNRRNFSGYVKKLILADIALKKPEISIDETITEPIKIKSSMKLYDPKEEVINVFDSSGNCTKMTQRELNALRLKEAQKKASIKPTELK